MNSVVCEIAWLPKRHIAEVVCYNVSECKCCRCLLQCIRLDSTENTSSVRCLLQRIDSSDNTKIFQQIVLPSKVMCSCGLYALLFGTGSSIFTVEFGCFLFFVSKGFFSVA